MPAPRLTRMRRVLAVLAVAALATACGAGESADTAAGEPAGSSSAAGGEQGVDALQAWYDGTAEQPPTTSPAPVAGKEVWVVTCAQASLGCKLGGDAAVEAGTALGWKMEVCDGKFNAGGAQGACLRQALSAGADGVLTFSIDCANMQQGLIEASTAKVPVINISGIDCDDPLLGGTDPLFAHSVLPSSAYPDNATYLEATGEARADWIIAQTDGKAKILAMDYEGQAGAAHVMKGFERGLEKCGDCEVVTIPFAGADIATGKLPAKFQAALVQNPDANAAYVTFDSFFLTGISQTIAASGRTDQLAVIGGEALPPNVEQIAEGSGGQDAAVSLPFAWSSYGAVDDLNRIFAGEQPVAQGFGFQLVDADHGIEGGQLVEKVDFRAAYRAAWGVS
ncbi:substrate-binding domain-containing protein [Modestobacter sp. I12A-02628]|uniref:Sugar ABC transporter substrate-binding protein n=1 Tax=Goekera deserti TaxID=2497753 RepID=A0A7K3WDT8_9ACTN|nr:substrate-binding domain-containing protein [Goekera deserti]MPQ99559.1 substrate-binding domain-containing protein [Goekera deserti]NDI46429.1 substrate-binding domain-containing protein [Goekera deserti]NEL54638.1 sugar ABC transporter substrate-binding protein [Goekera deserti]